MRVPRFSNPWPHDSHGALDVLRWKLGIGHREAAALPDAPDTPAGRILLDPGLIADPPDCGWRVVWLGHSSFLAQGAGQSLLIDPVFSTHCAPLRLPPFARLVNPPCTVADLPHIDAVLLTHSHYDHCDLPTLRALGTDTPLFVPSGHRRWLGKHGFTRVNELAWFESAETLERIRITATPAQHFTARGPFDRNMAHWCGWRIDGGGTALWHAGDSALCPAFREIGERLGAADLGMIPIGAYQPRSIMRSMHMNPEESVDVFLQTRCTRAVAMHWGTFRLTDEPLGEPPLRLCRALDAHSLSRDLFVCLPVGGVLTVPSA